MHVKYILTHPIQYQTPFIKYMKLHKIYDYFCFTTNCSSINESFNQLLIKVSANI